MQEMASLVSHDDMEARGKTEEDASRERVWESYAGQIEIGVRA